MTTPPPESTIRVNVDPTNPGQFFACCGLLELAHRLWPGATGHFANHGGQFHITVGAAASLSELLQGLKNSQPGAAIASGTSVAGQDDERRDDGDGDDDDSAGPMFLGVPFNLRLDWWEDKSLKPWAGSMNAEHIIRAMVAAIAPDHHDPLNDLRVVHDPADSTSSGKKAKKPKKREPFYFDARRGGNAKSLDVGFAPDAFSMESTACPAVESLCMVGLQRFRPMPTDRPRVFVYRAWTVPLPPCAAAAAACGLLRGVGGDLYRFENAFRTDQRKHKGFLTAIRIIEGDTP
jgi:CRISPR-associated protein Csb3